MNQISNSAGVVRTETYGYDNLYRLTTVNYGDGETQTYSFDSMGNRLTKTDITANANNSESYTYNAANMLLTRGANNYTNDANGNTLIGGGRTNTWDSQNRLTQCVYNGTTSQFTYASDGLRHRSVVTTGNNVTTTDSVLDGSMMVQEVASTNGGAPSTATYLIGPRGPEYRRDAFGTVKWYSYDGLGSVLGEVDLNGNLTATRSYDVYGAKRTSGGTQSTTHGFVGSLGHPSEDSTGMIYMRARYMDPAVGRFVSEDPSLNGANWYVYGGSNPINSVDKTGKTNYWIASDIALFAGLALTFAALFKGYDRSPIGVARSLGYASLASACFGLSLAFSDGNQHIGIGMAILAGVQAYGSTIAVLVFSSQAAIESGLGGFVTPAIVCCCIEGLMAIGVMASANGDF